MAITPRDIIGNVGTLEPFTLKAVEAGMCRLALNKCNGSIIKAAALLGITRHALKRRMVKHMIKDRPGK